MFPPPFASLVTIATGRVCRALVGKPGADFLVQCGAPLSPDQPPGSQCGQCSIRQPAWAFGPRWETAYDPRFLRSEHRVAEPSEILGVGTVGAPEESIFGLVRSGRSEVQ